MLSMLSQRKDVRMIILMMAGLMLAGQSVQGEDLAVVQSRLLDSISRDQDRAAVAELLGSQETDGSWPDVDYSCRARARWSIYRHLSKLATLAQAHAAGDERPALKAAIPRGLDYWYKHDFRNSNWWWNVIGVPAKLGEILVLMGDDLDDARRQSGVKILERAEMRGMTGANLLDVARIVLMRGVVEENPNTLGQAVRHIEREIAITSGEGIQADYSFHQHGDLLYNFGYGAGFMLRASGIAKMVAGTKYEFKPEKIELLSSLALDGTRWMLRGNTKDYGATGRGITRPSDGDSTGFLCEVSDNLMQVGSGREDEFQELVRVLNSNGADGFPRPVNRQFWRSDFMTHNRPHFYTSVRMHSKRTLSNDPIINDEGYCTHHLADGCTYIMKSGREYHNIFPAWDWKLIPGTTVELKDLPPREVQRRGTTAFVGGVSDGQYGMAAFDFVRGELTARKAWWFFDEEIVCLGAGISCESGREVVTTLNQCLLSSDVIVRERDTVRRMDKGEHILQQPAWVAHNGIIYHFLQPAVAMLGNQTRQGSWWRLNRAYSREAVEKDVFALSIQHGKNPANASYAYMVSIPRNEQDHPSPTGHYSGPIKIVSNTELCQVVYHRKLRIAGAVFYEKGEVQLSKSLRLGVDKPCLVLVRAREDKIEISVSSPENEPGSIRVAIEGMTGDENGTAPAAASGAELVFELPGRDSAGRSVTRTLVRSGPDQR